MVPLPECLCHCSPLPVFVSLLTRSPFYFLNSLIVRIALKARHKHKRVILKETMRPMRASAEMERTRVAATSHEVVAQPSVRWTLDNVVEDVLMEDCGGLGDMGLHDFLMEHFEEDFGTVDVSMCAFIHNPGACIGDECSREEVTDLEPYKELLGKYELYKTMREGVDSLHDMRIFSLRHWESAAAASEAEGIDDSLRGKLNAALLIARRNEERMMVGNASSGVEIDGAYDAVVNARWSYVVRSDEYGGGTLGMGVLDVAPREQVHLWSEAQADVIPDPWKPWEGDVVPGVSGKLVMAVLSSEKGWPHMLFSADDVRKERVQSLTEYNAVCDAYIRKEDLRVWHIVKKNIDEWSSGVGIFLPFLLIGTRGIGKSCGTGSLLLYQLLHSPLERLEVVAYFVSGKAYIFHRKERRVVYYRKQSAAVGKIKGMTRRGICGYIIFDTGKESIGAGDLVGRWGIILISSPNEKKFQKIIPQRPHALQIYICCYEDVELKAALVWERHWQLEKKLIKLEDVNLENDWKVLKERIGMVGPLPRYVLANKSAYEKRLKDVKSALGLISHDIGRYSELLCNPHKWHENGTTHKLMKVTRRRVHGKSMCWDEPISTYVWKELQRRAFTAPLTEDVIRRVLFSEQAQSD
ncbi:unnamed protein product [Trypanosoma congolense IL3000]|uniref:WGS project CAEQ00000000 data, annotated contig 1913 n=1 Tax=Trypanosoma congolense (strain IL3000) TaxID=1068625 RepID=F9WA05_TRYCI|nr:unnamed protein product [Trypanosoma congolense IL3000]